jgi:hypothetical protein
VVRSNPLPIITYHNQQPIHVVTLSNTSTAIIKGTDHLSSTINSSLYLWSKCSSTLQLPQSSTLSRCYRLPYFQSYQSIRSYVNEKVQMLLRPCGSLDQVGEQPTHTASSKTLPWEISGTSLNIFPRLGRLGVVFERVGVPDNHFPTMHLKIFFSVFSISILSPAFSGFCIYRLNQTPSILVFLKVRLSVTR